VAVTICSSRHFFSGHHYFLIEIEWRISQIIMTSFAFLYVSYFLYGSTSAISETFEFEMWKMKPCSIQYPYHLNTTPSDFVEIMTSFFYSFFAGGNLYMAILQAITETSPEGRKAYS